MKYRFPNLEIMLHFHVTFISDGKWKSVVRVIVGAFGHDGNLWYWSWCLGCDQDHLVPDHGIRDPKTRLRDSFRSNFNPEEKKHVSIE